MMQFLPERDTITTTRTTNTGVGANEFSSANNYIDMVAYFSFAHLQKLLEISIFEGNKTFGRQFIYKELAYYHQRRQRACGCSGVVS